MTEKVNETEQIEDLQCKGLKIIQDKSLYTFTSDSVILANFLKIKQNEVAVEIGTGCGVISILASAKNSANKIIAFEMDEKLALLAKRNIEFNKLTDKIQIIHDKIQNYSLYLNNESVNVVFSNPPYMKSINNNLIKNQIRENARHDKNLSIAQLCSCASNLLKFGGRFYVVYGAERSCELIYNLKQAKLEPKTMFFTENGKGKVVLVVIEAVKGGKSGVKILPNLVTNKQDGEFLEKLQTRNFIN